MSEKNPEIKITEVSYQVYEAFCRVCENPIRSSSEQSLNYNLRLHETKCYRDSQSKKVVGRPPKNHKWDPETQRYVRIIKGVGKISKTK